MRLIGSCDECGREIDNNKEVYYQPPDSEKVYCEDCQAKHTA